MFYDGNNYMGSMHGFWWIFWVLFVGVLVFYYSWGRPSAQRRRPRDTPHDVLQRRLAGGEIAPEEYEKHKALLDRDAGGKPQDQRKNKATPFFP